MLENVVVLRLWLPLEAGRQLAEYAHGHPFAQQRDDAEDAEKEKEKKRPMPNKLKTKDMVKAKVDSTEVAEVRDLLATTVEGSDTLQQSVGLK